MSHVRRGKAARERRYESAVRRQVRMYDSSLTGPRPQPYLYAGPEEFLRPGDELERFRSQGDMESAPYSPEVKR